MHLAISGNIGSGKTTLTKKLATHYGWEPVFEEEQQNPYLEDFYQDMEAWAFHLQVYFLTSRFNQVSYIRKAKTNVIQDRTIYEDAHIFAKNLVNSGIMNGRDYANYTALYASLLPYTAPPDLLVYLRADIDHLVEQIKKRGRTYEGKIPVPYLKNLNILYESWIKTYNSGPLLVIEVEKLDFVSRPEDFNKITTQIDEVNPLFKR